MNLYQSSKNDGKSVKESKEEKDSIKTQSNYNLFEKLVVEEVDQLQKIIHTEFKNCRVKCITPENQDIRYPSLALIYEVVLKTV